MNPAETRELMGDIVRLRERGFTILLIEHDMGLVRGVCDRVVALDHGVKIAEGDFADGRTTTRPCWRPTSASARRPCLSWPLLQLQDVVTYYGPIQALKGVSLEVGRARSSACSAATRRASRPR